MLGGPGVDDIECGFGWFGWHEAEHVLQQRMDHGVHPVVLEGLPVIPGGLLDDGQDRGQAAGDAEPLFRRVALIWVTTVTVHSDGMEDDWVWVDVNAPPSGPRPTASHERLVKEVDAADAWWTGVPHMVREILSVADACDGEMILAARPTLVPWVTSMA